MADKLRDKRAGGTVKYTAQYFAGARFVAVNPKLTRNSNCYMGIGRLGYMSIPRGEKERFAGITERFRDRNRNGHLVKRNCRETINFTVLIPSLLPLPPHLLFFLYHETRTKWKRLFRNDLTFRRIAVSRFSIVLPFVSFFRPRSSVPGKLDWKVPITKWNQQVRLKAM